MNAALDISEEMACLYCGHRYIARFVSTTSELALFLENHRRYRAVLHSFLAHCAVCKRQYYMLMEKPK